MPFEAPFEVPWPLTFAVRRQPDVGMLAKITASRLNFIDGLTLCGALSAEPFR